MEEDDSVMRMPQSVIDRERQLRRLNEELDRDAGTASNAAFKPSTSGQATLFDSADELTADDREYAKQLLSAVGGSTLSNNASNSGHATFGRTAATGRHAAEEQRESAVSEQARRSKPGQMPASAIPKPRAGGARRLRAQKQRVGGQGVPDRPGRSDRSDEGNDPDSSGAGDHAHGSRQAALLASSRYTSSKRAKRTEASSTRPASAYTHHTEDQGRAAPSRPPLQLHPDVPPETAVRLLQAEAEALRGDVREATTARLAATRRLKDVTSAAREARRDADALRKRLDTSEAARRRAMEEADRLRQRAGQATTEAKSMEQAAREQRKAASGGDRERQLLETRLRRKTEECEALREQLKQEQERRKRSVHDATQGVDALRKQVRVLERQRAHLMEGFKRQMRLIDLLKQQRMHLEAARALEFTEIEFARALDSGSLPVGERVWTVEEASKAAGIQRGKGAAGRGGVSKGASHGSGRSQIQSSRAQGGQPVQGGRRPGSKGGQQRAGRGRG